MKHNSRARAKHLNYSRSVATTLQATVDELSTVWINSRKPPFRGSKRREDCLSSDMSSGSNSDMFNGDSASATSSAGEEVSTWPDSQTQPLPSQPPPPLSIATNGLEVHKHPHSMSPPPIGSSAELPQHTLEPSSSTAGHNESINETVQNLLRSLSVRGTGNHTCPYGAACNKGGFRNGHAFIFGRNSAFR